MSTTCVDAQLAAGGAKPGATAKRQALPHPREQPWDIVHHGAKPNLTQVGPLRYYYKQKKFNVTWDAEEAGDVVTYRQWQYYVPVDDATVALALTNVTSIYVPLLGILSNPLGAAALA